MKNIFRRNEDSLINLMCLAPGTIPVYSMVTDNMSEEDIPRI